MRLVVDGFSYELSEDEFNSLWANGTDGLEKSARAFVSR